MSLIFVLALASFGCRKDGYVAEVTDLQLVRMDPETGYSGAIVKILGRNFSTKAKENIVIIGGKETKVLDAGKWDLTVVLPEHEPGEYEVEVQTPKARKGGLTFRYKVKPEHTYLTSIYVGKAGSKGSTDGQGSDARLDFPEGIIPARTSGEYWILQRGSFAIRKLDAYGSVTTIKTSGVALNYPWQGAEGPSGDLYFCNKGDGKLLKIDGNGVISEISTGMKLSNPMGVTFDKDGYGYVSVRNTAVKDDEGNEVKGTVLKIKDDAVVKTYPIPQATCSTVDASGRIIVGSNNAGYLFTIGTDGKISRIAGEGNIKGSCGDGTPGDLLGKSTIGSVNGIWCAKDGSVYFCDITALSVRKLTPDGSGDYSKGKIETIASGFYPSDIVVSDDCSKIFVTSATTHTIRMIEVI